MTKHTDLKTLFPPAQLKFNQSQWRSTFVGTLLFGNLRENVAGLRVQFVGTWHCCGLGFAFCGRGRYQRLASLLLFDDSNGRVNEGGELRIVSVAINRE